jgi:Fuc2NAc and GlcNAc transferase
MSLELSLGAVLLLTFALSWFLCAGVVLHGGRIGLLQAPNHRSSHSRPTPQGGGIGIVISVLGVAWVFGSVNEYLPLFAAALGIAIVGFWDDVRQVPVLLRLLVQTAACLTVMTHVQTLPGHALVTADWPVAVFPFLVLLIGSVWWINLFNFMDGIDGLAASQAVFMLLGAAYFVVTAHPALISHDVWRLMTVIVAATLGFLFWNRPCARVFMGDVGSTFLAFMLLTLCFLTVHKGWLSVPVWLILAAGFVTDATVTLLIRMAGGKRWTEAHRSHIYQRLAVRWNGHGWVDVLFMSVNLVFLFPSALLAFWLPELAWLITLAVYVPLLVIAYVLQMKAFRND